MAATTTRRSARFVAPFALGALLFGVFVPGVQAIVGKGAATTAGPSRTDDGSGSMPPLQDVARGKVAEQSSTAYGGTPDRAVDGDTNGDHFANSVTHTSNGPGEWWQVDLGASFDIREIVLWNRTDCCAERLHDVMVLVSDTPLPAGAVSDPTGWSKAIGGPAGRETRIPVGIKGRYVRVQHTVADYLSLAEVEVWAAAAPTPTPTPTATSATSGVWALVAGSPRNETTKGSMDPTYSETFGGGAGSASIAISIQPPDPHDPPAFRSDSFAWTQPPATLRPGDRMVTSLAIAEQTNSGNYYSPGLFARFTQPGQPCGIVRDGDIDVGIVMIGSLMDPPPPSSGEFIVPVPAPGFSGPATSEQMQLQVCANVYQSRTASYYVYEWKPAIATAPSGPQGSPTATPPAQAKLVVQVTAPTDVPVGNGGPDVIRYLVRVTNEGNAPATAPSISWTASFGSVMPLAVEIVRVSSGWTCQVTNGDNHPGAADCSGGSLAPGASATLEVTLDAPPELDVVRATVAASGACGAAGQCGDGWHGVTTVGGGGAKLQIKITAPTQVKAGDPIVYTVVVTNVGTAPATDANVLVVQGLTVSAVTGPVGWTCQAGEVVDGATLNYPNCGPGTLKVGEVGSMTFAGVMPPDFTVADSKVMANAAVSARCGAVRCKASDAAVTTVIYPSSPLKLSVTAPSDVTSGQPIKVLVRVTNAGTAAVTISGENVEWDTPGADRPESAMLDVMRSSLGDDCFNEGNVQRCHRQITIDSGDTVTFDFTTAVFLTPAAGELEPSTSISANVTVSSTCKGDGWPCDPDRARVTTRVSLGRPPLPIAPRTE